MTAKQPPGLAKSITEFSSVSSHQTIKSIYDPMELPAQNTISIKNLKTHEAVMEILEYSTSNLTK